MKVIINKNQTQFLPIELKETNKKLEVVLAGENASVEVIGLVLPARSYFDASGSTRTRVKERSLAGEGNGSDDRSLEVYITHAAPNTKSNVNVRAVLRDKSTFSFRGNVRIEKGAKGADAYLRSDALLFDEAKMGDDTPALEILEPDVKAGHAATIGKVDEQMLFYLMSRGLSKKQAEEMLIEGFTKPILEKLRKPARSYFDASGSTRTRVKERSLAGDSGGELVVKS